MRTSRDTNETMTRHSQYKQQINGKFDLHKDQPEIVKLSTADLTSGQPYQRPLDKRFIEDKIVHFDINKVKPVTVSYRDGKYYIIDGQHTVLICKGHNGGKDCLVDCRVLYNLTLQDEAKLYNEQYSDTHKLSSADKWMGWLVEGKSEALAIAGAVQRAGCTMGIDPSQRGYARNRIIAIESLPKMYKVLGARGLTRALTLLRNTFDGENAAFKRAMLLGMMEFMSLYGGDIDELTFQKRVGKSSPNEIIEMSKTDRVTSSPSMRVAKVLFKLYNFKCVKNKLRSKFEY